MNISKKIFPLSLLLLFLTIYIGCEKNPASHEPDKPADSDPDLLSTLTVIFENDKGNLVDYNSELGLFRTDGVEFAKTYDLQHGRAQIDSLSPGSYSVAFYFYFLSAGKYIYIYYANDVVVKAHQINETRFIFPSEVEYNIFLASRNWYIKDKETWKHLNIPIPDAVITTVPETVTVTTDAQGRATLGTFPLQEFDFIITKKNMTFTTYKHSKHIGFTYYITNGKFELVISLPGNWPLVEIISPIDNEYLFDKDIHFNGDGCYITDEPLPDSVLTWYSDIDGELGKGREIAVESLSIGHHTITLVGVDHTWRKYEAEHSITLNVSFFNDVSYFPLPYGGYWNYRYHTTDFSMTGETGETEYWTIGDLQVSADDVDTRSCLMEYTITKGNTTKYCRYRVVDYYETDSENIYVAKTTEQIQIFNDENKQDKPAEQLDIETVYTPRYLLIKQYMDPVTESSYETSVTSDVTWEYYRVNNKVLSVTETIDIETSYKIGETEITETETGTFEAVPLTILTGDTVRRWWLAKRIGIIQLEYTTFDFPLTATLYDTNILTFSEDSQAKSISKSSHYGANHLQKVFKSPPDTPERMLELCRLLRGLCPR